MMSSSPSLSSSSWAAYWLILVLRVVIASLLPGYLHPDEFFQGGQELFFGCPPSMIPWEFTSAIRSIVPPTIMTYLPLQLYRSLFLWNNKDLLTGWEVLIIPRLVCGVLSILTVDASVYQLTRNASAAPDGTMKANPTSSQWILQTSWPVWVILSRPFTNGLETMWLAVLMLLVSRLQTRAPPQACVSSSMETLALGAICALGIFTRFTFVFFAIPSMLLYIWQKRSAILDVSICALGFVATSGLIIAADVSYYGYLVVTPWNALQYNSQVSNLQEHGLHPHWTHALVNMMLLFGPMALLFYAKVISGGIGRAKANFAINSASNNNMHNVCTWTIVCGLAFLSLAPHQEPRFLAPLMVPLSILMGGKLWTNLNLRIVWIGFNLILLVVFGVLHQGGVVPSLLLSADAVISIQQEKPSSFSMLFHKTYMPPSFLSRQRRQTCNDQACLANTSCPAFEVLDLQGDYDLEEIMTLHCDKNEATKNLYLVAPPHTIDANIHLTHRVESIWAHWPHLTTEDLPSLFDKDSSTAFISSFQLVMYSVQCPTTGRVIIASRQSTGSN